MKQAKVGVMFACCLVMAGAALAQAQEAAPRTYAVMSLIGDNLSVSPLINASGSTRRIAGVIGSWTMGGNTGSRLDMSRPVDVPLKETNYDDAAVATLAGAIRQRDPAAAVELLPARDSGLYAKQDRLFDSSPGSKSARESLRAMLKEHHATHLVIVTKNRSEVEMLGDSKVFADAQLQLLSASSDDTIRLEGIGFYVDDMIKVQDLKTLDPSTGVLASFINANVRLVDAKTLDVIRETVITKSNIIAIAKPLEAGFSAWDEATEAQKSASLMKLIRVAMEDTASRILSKSP